VAGHWQIAVNSASRSHTLLKSESYRSGRLKVLHTQNWCQVVAGLSHLGAAAGERRQLPFFVAPIFGGWRKFTSLVF
jgi:hypothetical protein